MADGVENPYYSPHAAHDCLSLIMVIARIVKKAKAEGENKQQYDQILGYWSTFPEVLQEFEADLPQLEQEVRDIADTCGIDIQDGRRNVLYRHTGERGRGVFEFEMDKRKTSGFASDLMPALPKKVTDPWNDFADRGGDDWYAQIK